MDIARLVEVLDDSGSSLDIRNWIEWATGGHIQTYAPVLPTNKPEMIRKVIETMLDQEKQGRPGLLELFLLEAYRDRPMRPSLRKKIAEFAPRIEAFAKLDNARLHLVSGNGQKEWIEANLGAGVQAIHQKLMNPAIPFVDGIVWARSMYENLTRVCLIEIDDQPAGTGFLVGPTAVLTNWHVVEQVANTPTRIACRFDYAVDVSGKIERGTKVALGQNGILVSSPYWANEKQPATFVAAGAPVDCCDFALLEINAAELPNAAQRSFVALTQSPPMPASGAALIVLQHPAGAPVQMGIDTAGVIGWELRDLAGNPVWTTAGQNTRFRYRTNTLGGSSGSPCFSADWTLVALHHMGHGGQLAAINCNQGVPAGLIYKAIVNAGHAAALGTPR